MVTTILVLGLLGQATTNSLSFELGGEMRVGATTFRLPSGGKFCFDNECFTAADLRKELDKPSSAPHCSRDTFKSDGTTVGEGALLAVSGGFMVCSPEGWRMAKGGDKVERFSFIAIDPDGISKAAFALGIFARWILALAMFFVGIPSSWWLLKKLKPFYRSL